MSEVPPLATRVTPETKTRTICAWARKVTCGTTNSVAAVVDPGTSRVGDSTSAPPSPRSRTRADRSPRRRTEASGGQANRVNRRRSAGVSSRSTALLLCNGQPDIHLAKLERRQERLDDPGIEVRRSPFDDDVFGIEGRHRFAIGAVARQRIVDVGDRDDARLDRNLLAPRGVITGSVELVV